MTCQEFIKYGKEKGFTDIQIVEETSNNIDSSYINEKLDANNSSFSISYFVKAEKDNKTVKISTDYLEKNIIDLLDLKIENEDSSYQDEYLTDLTNNNSLSLEKIDITDEIKTLKTIYKLKENNNIKSITSCYSGSSYKKRIVNSKSVDISTTKKVYDFYIEVLVEKNGNIVSASSIVSKVIFSIFICSLLVFNALEE